VLLQQSIIQDTANKKFPFSAFFLNILLIKYFLIPARYKILKYGPAVNNISIIIGRIF